MRLRFLNREYRFCPLVFRFKQLLRHRRLKEKDHRKALKPLAVVCQRQPRPTTIVTQHYARAAEHVPNVHRKHAKFGGAGCVVDRNLCRET